MYINTAPVVISLTEFSNPGAIFQVYRTPLKKSGYNVKIPLSFHKGAFFKSFLQNYEMTT